MFIPYLSSLHLIKAYSAHLAKELLHVNLLIFHFAELLIVACSADLAKREVSYKITQKFLLDKNLIFTTHVH